MESSGDEHIKKIQQAHRTAYLVAGFIRQTLTRAEQQELDAWITESDENMRLFGELTDEKNIAVSLQAYDKINTEEALTKVKDKWRRRPGSRPFWQYAIAASVLIGLVLTIFFLNNQKAGEQEVTGWKNDILPGSGQATLTMGKGNTIWLGKKDTIINATINVSASMSLISFTGSQQGPEEYNTLACPRKAQFSIVLNDGTKVWLNAESSIRFPGTFSDHQRIVFVTGETYFEVAKDPSRPFRVVAGDMIVQALGTQFNVNAYSDEPAKVTTLVEGKVKVRVTGDSVLLLPGEQTVVTEGKITKTNAEITTVTAWKDNKFKFRNTELSVIMRQLARWYDADIEFKEPVPVHLNATIDRSVPLSRVLDLLQETNEVKFEIKNNKIIVSR
jgi:ferric-dicitrate binding protein FerR (iron transport regulator)